MTVLVFPDNTVLINFAIMRRTDLLAQLVQDRGRWTVTIESECNRSAKETGLEELVDVGTILGDPLIPTGVERLATELIRRQLAKPDDSRTQHLGEAETFAIVSQRAINALFVTDDLSAARFARTIPVKTATTADLVKLAVRTGKLGVDAAWSSVMLLRNAGRFLSGAPHNFDLFRAWCAS